MRKNEILEEIWRNRDEFARGYNNDLDAMVAALLEMEKHALNEVVDRRQITSDEKAPEEPSE
jgi:hypothetical protein